jgi:hypothetical protein
LKEFGGKAKLLENMEQLRTKYTEWGTPEKKPDKNSYNIYVQY